MDDKDWISSLVHLYLNFIDFVFRFLELHLVKIVALSIMAFCCFNVNVLHMFVVLVLVVSILMGLKVVVQAFRLIAMYLSILLLTKMMYQTKFIPKITMNTNCTDLPFEERVWMMLTDLRWMGYHVLEKEESLLKMCRSYLLVLLVTTLQYIVYARQRFKRIQGRKSDRIPAVLFEKITRKDADESITNGIKFILSYGFYKFGLELTLTMAALVAAFRMDVMSVFYSLWLVTLFLLRRSDVATMWPLLFVSVALTILCQYGMAVGLSPHVCLEYPWKFPEPITRWFFLASFETPPDGRYILMDFLLLLFIWRQMVVFDIEKKNLGNIYAGGCNKEIYMDYNKPDFFNPVPDHTMFHRSAVGWIKNSIVSSMMWVTLGVVYWCGVYNMNILSLGYLTAAFLFLWIGYDICLWDTKKILKWWNILLIYTVSVMTIKSMYELAGCAYLNVLTKEVCWLVQLLNLGCSTMKPAEHKRCIMNKGSRLYLDAVCFGFLLFQRRLFSSCYFLHHMLDMKAIVRIQSKGAKLIEQLMQQKMAESENKKKKTLEKVKNMVKRIKEWQKNIKGPGHLEPMDHATAVHMGDYYMFEDDFEFETISEETSSSSDDGSKEKFIKTKKVKRNFTMTEFIDSVLRKAGENGEPRFREKNARDSTFETEETVGDTSDEYKAASSNRSGVQLKKNVTRKKESSESRKATKMKAIIRFLMEFIESVCVSMILYFNKHSKDYRFIEAAMDEERTETKILSKTDFGLSSTSSPGPRSALEGIHQINSSAFRMTESRTDEKFHHEKRRYPTVFYQLIISLSFFVMSHTEFFCYAIIFLHQALSPTILSLPLPLCALLWGSLTTIRPTTTFWVVLIAYAEVTILIKAIFQNWIFPWNRYFKHGTNSHHPPLLLGIHRNNSYAIADLFLLFVLFLHRYKMKRLGMWKRTNEEETLRPQNMGIYREVQGEKDEYGYSIGLERELENYRRTKEATVKGSSVPRLGKWKCTSRAMAGIFTREMKVWTRLNVQEIEGRILVTHRGRRLVRAEERPVAEGDSAGEVVLRVYSSRYISASRNLICKLSCLQHFTPLRKFFIQIIDQKGRLSRDFYTPMFFSQFLTFLIIFFGFSHFTDIPMQRLEDHFYFTQDQVPPSYLLTVFLHFIVIIIDRVLYLRKHVVGKLIMQIVQVIVIHIWMFLIVPRMTETSFAELTVPQIYYLITCIYFLMSAYQMRVGYPLRVQGHFLCKKYRFINYISYKFLQFIPFFNQLRTVLDYICISTSLSIMEWVKMESIYQAIFENKCLRKADENYPSRRGIKYPRCNKYIPGIIAFIFIVFIMWFPFILFAIFETVSERNQPRMAVLDLTMGSFGKVYSTTTSHESIIPFTSADYDKLRELYRENNKAWTFLSGYNFEDVAVLKFRFQPLESWDIRADEFDRLNNTIQARAVAIPLYLSWSIFRTERAQIAATAHGMREVTLEKSGSLRDEFAKAFNGEGNRIFMKHMLPKFIKVNNEGNALPVSGFLSPRNRTNPFRNISLRLTIVNGENGTSISKHWELVELSNDDLESNKISKIPYQDSKYITIYTFNEKSIPKPLLNISRRGIIGLYLSIVFFTWSVVKRFMCKYPNIMYEDMPNVDRILQLCHDIFLARESHEFALEEDLYAKLIFLFRSPETLIKWTRFNVREE